MEKLWTTSEVAKFLGIDEADVERLVRQGTLTGYKLGGQFLRFRPDQVQPLKHQVQIGGQATRPAKRPARSWFGFVRDLLYFYDFYLISAALLAVMLVYLIVAS